jgi:IclR family acetate operon transcriptional repressor
MPPKADVKAVSAQEQRRPRGRPKAFNDKTEQNTIKSLDRALATLHMLAELEGASLTGLSEALKQSPATVYRILTTFESHGIVEMDTATQTWHVGPGAFLIGSVFLRRTNLVERSRPILRTLMEATGETANLGVTRGDMVLFVSQMETHDNLRAFFPPGAMTPLYVSGVGKALLAQEDEARLEALLTRQPLEAFTPKTITDPAQLIADLRATKARGYAIDDEERNLGMRCVAAPVFDAMGDVVAGISVSGPTIRVRTQDTAEIAHHVRHAARELSASLGSPDAFKER